MDSNIERYTLPLIIFFVTVTAALIARKVVFAVLHRWAGRTETRVDDIIIRSVNLPSIFWVFALSIYISIETSDLPKQYAFYLTKGLYLLIILSVTTTAANLSGQIFRDYVEKTGLPIPATGLANGLIRGVIICIGFLIILSVMGISIAPLLTALGVGGLAVALALQDTLSNLFAGIHILVEKPVRIGDFIKLETGQEGYVEDIGWRTTRIRMLPNNMVIIPNSKLTQSVLTNYHLPEKRLSLLISVGVSYSSDPDKVEKVLVDAAKKAVGEVPGLLGEPEPFVRFIPGFGESSLDFTLICQVNEFVDQYLAQHELRKRIFRRFNEEGIEIPFPHRTVYLREEKECKR